MPITTTDRQAPLFRRLGWFVLIWAASVLTLAIVGLAIKLALR